MALDIFQSESNPVFQNQVERRLAADIAGAFDRNYQAAQRSRNRYNLTPSDTDMWGIERSRTLVDAINRNRINERNLDEQQRLANERNAAIAAARPQGGMGTSNNQALQDLLNQLRNPPGRNLDAARTQGLTRGLSGLAQFLPFLLGNDTYSNLMRQGLLGIGRDAYNNIFNAPSYRDNFMSGPIPLGGVPDPDNWDLQGYQDYDNWDTDMFNAPPVDFDNFDIPAFDWWG